MVKNSGATLNLGIEHVGVVDADQELNVGLDVHLLEGVHDRPLRRQRDRTHGFTFYFSKPTAQKQRDMRKQSCGKRQKM